MMKVTCMPSGALGVNTYLAVDESTGKGFIVDPGGYNPKLTEKVREDGVDIKYIILTHGHSDHICGVNDHLDDFPQAKVVADEAEKPMLEDARLNQSTMFGSPQTVKADIWVKDGDELEVERSESSGSSLYSGPYSGWDVHICGIGKHPVQRRHSVPPVHRQDGFPGRLFPAVLADAIHSKLFVLPDDTAVLPRATWGLLL